MDDQRPKVGVGVLVFKNGKVLLGKRKGSHGEGMYAGPGGHLEHFESIIDCAIRETKEETRVRISQPRFLCVTNFLAYAPKHYLDIGIVAEWKAGEPVVLEPTKCDEWKWYSVDTMPSPLFPTVRNYFIALKTGQTFFDIPDVERVLKETNI